MNLESDLFTERRERALERRMPSAWIHELNARKLKRHETELAGLAHELWFISPEDQRHYALRNPEAQNTRLVPPTYSSSLRAFRSENFRKARHPGKPVLGFLGGMHFLPNRISAEWIVERLAPKLAERGFDGELRIAGPRRASRARGQSRALPVHPARRLPAGTRGFLDEPLAFAGPASERLRRAHEAPRSARLRRSYAGHAGRGLAPASGACANIRCSSAARAPTRGPSAS